MKLRYRVSEIDIFICSECEYMTIEGLMKDTEVRDLYKDEYFEGCSAGYPNYLAEESQLRKRGSYYRSIVEEQLLSNGHILDIGCAAGFVLDEFAKSGWKCEGVEPNFSMRKYATDELSLNVYPDFVETMSERKECYDVVLMLQVLEHLRQPFSFVERLHSWASERSLVIVETWNFRSLFARLLGSNWHQLSPPWVLHWFTPKSLDTIFDAAGFEPVALGSPWRTITWEHAISALSLKFGKTLVFRLAKRILRRVPADLSIPYPPFDLFWRMYRKKAS